MRIGQRVMLIGTDGFMPPMGSIGTVQSPIYEDGDCEVLFPEYPCPNPPGITWVAHWTWLLPLSDGEHETKLEQLECKQP